jgi:hypothetical protein
MTMIVPTKRKRALTDKQRAAAIIANTRAAAIFGDAPLFDAPRVQPAALKAAVLDVIARTWNTLPHVAPMRATDIVIQYVGRTAFTRHEWQHDAKGRLHVTGAVNLPALPASGTMSRAQANEYLGYILHEVCGHWLHTNPNAWATACSVYASSTFRNEHVGISPEYARNVLNALEDVRIERALIASGMVRGAAQCLRATLGAILAEARGDFDASDIADFPFALAYAMREHAGASDLLDDMPSALRCIYDAAAASMDALRDCPAQDGTQLTHVVTVAVLDALVPILDAQPDQPPVHVNPQPSDDGDQPSDDGDSGDQPSDDDSGDSNGNSDSGDADGDSESGDSGDDAPRDQPHGNARSAGRDSNIKLRGDCDDLSGSVQPPVVETETITDSMRSRAEYARSEIKKLGNVPVTRGALRRVLECSANDSLEAGKRSGRVNPGALARVATGADNVFRRRTMRDGIRAAVAICIDGSSSMQGDIHAASMAALVLADICHDAGALVDVSVFRDASVIGPDMGYQHGYIPESESEKQARAEIDASSADTSVNARDALRGKRCKLATVKGFAEPIAAGYARVADVYANGNTPDLAALTSVCERVLQQDAGRRLVVFVTDGCGDAASVMTQAVNKYRALGVSIVAIGIGNEPACDAYPYRATVAHAGDLGSASMREVLRALADAPEARAVGMGD